MNTKKIIYFIPLLAILLFSIYLVDRDTNLLNDNSSEQKVPGIYEALSYMSAVRAYPAADIKPDGYTRAFEYSRRNLQADGKRDDQWTAIGPRNIGGRTLDMSLNQQNPNTIYAASASGGLWRSYQGGVGNEVWERIITGFPALAIGAVEVAPLDSNIIFIGTGECYGYGTYFPSVSFRATRGLNGMGILKSIDNGETWVKSLDWSYNQNRGIQRIKFDPFHTNIVWAATTEGTYKSTDTGESWELVHEVPMATDIAVHPEDSDIVFVACGGMFSDGNGIYRTLDGGDTWTKMDMGPSGPVTFGGKARIAIAPSSPNMVYASIGQSQSYGAQATWLCVSINTGDTWMVVNNQDYSSYQGWYSHYVGVSPFNAMKIFCAGIHLYQSENGGTNMTVKEGLISDWFHPDWLHLDHHDIEFHPTNPNIIYFAHDGGVHRTDDGGTNFYSCNWGYQTSQFYPGFSCSNTDSLFASGGLQDNFSCIWDGEPNWRRVVGGDGSHSAINQENNDIIYNSYQYLSMRLSYDKGYNYYDITPPNQGNTNFIAPYLLSPVDNTTIYAASSIVHKSINGGQSWSQTNTSSQFNNNPAMAMGLSSTDVNVVYVATTPWYTSHGIYKTSNGGIDWTDITADLPNRWPSDIHVDVNNHNIVYITYGGFGTSHLFKSSNGGMTWQDIGSLLPDIPGWAVMTDPLYPDNIYYGNEFGVYFSSDGGNTWEEFIEGLGDGVFAMDLKISESNRKLRVATHGNGVFERSLVGYQVGINEQGNSVSSIQNIKAFPNPFSNETTISYSVEKDGQVFIAIYNLNGNTICVLKDDVQNAGSYNIKWNGCSDKGIKTEPGTYICRTFIGGGQFSLKLIHN